MSARTMPTMPSWAAAQRILASQLQAITTYNQFFTSPPMFRMYQAITQTLTTATYTQITMDTLVYDTDSGRAPGTPWTYTVPYSGRWQFEYGVGFASNATGARVSALYQNGLDVSQTIGAQSSVSTDMAARVVVISCTAGDTIAVYGWQNSGGNLATDVSVMASSSYFEGRLISLASP